FLLYTIIVFFSVILSAFIDNIPYVATMLPVVQGITEMMNGGAGVEPYVFYFGLLIGATLGGNLTPIGASANIAAIGILRKNGYEVKNKDFLRIGVPFTLAAVLTGYVYLWIVWGI
ncbi:MAG: arsenic transporter, partial [Clostridiales bacterium]|nr:arsenic transporter [Clostridiales bacterium]